MTEIGFPWHQTTVAKIEGAARPVRLNEAHALAYALQTSLYRLVSQEHDDPEAKVQSLRKEVAFRLEIQHRDEERLAEVTQRLEKSRAAVAAAQVLLAEALKAQEEDEARG